LSLELQTSADDDHFIEEVEEFLMIMDNNDVDEEDFYEYLNFNYEDELGNDLTQVEFSDSDQEPTLQWQR